MEKYIPMREITQLLHLPNRAFWHLLTGCALLGFMSPVSAIVNMEDMHFSDGKPGGSGSLLFDYSGAKGNEDKSQSGMGFNYRFASEESLNLFSANYRRGESNGVRDTNNAFLHARHIREMNNKKAWEVFAQLEKNEFTRLKLRSLFGGGLRKKITDRDKTQQYLGLGLFYAIEKLDPAKVVDEEAETRNTRVNFYSLNRLVWSDNTKFYFTLYAQPVINDWKDYRLLGIASLNVAIDQHLSLKLSYNVSHDSEPPALVKQTDSRYMTGFEYHF